MIVLIVDADEATRQVTLRKAASWFPRPEAHAVGTAQEARRFAASKRVDLVIIEPSIEDGPELARDLRSINPLVRFIVQTHLEADDPAVVALRGMSAERVIHKA